MHIAVSGASGLVGQSLLPELAADGHRVARLVRKQNRENRVDSLVGSSGEPSEVQEIIWNPEAEFDARGLDGVDTVIHLAGKRIADARWTPSVKEGIRRSRVSGTRALCEGLARMPSPPRRLVCASAVGFYGSRGDELLTEESPAGTGFLAEVVRQWEAAAQPAIEAGIRVIHLRFGMILSANGGALAKMLLPFKLGLGGRVGSGEQYWSWISIRDVIGVIGHVLAAPELHGPVNVVAPDLVTNKRFTRALGAVLHRPTILPLPAMLARLVLGEMADELLLSSLRVIPEQLMRSGYAFQHSSLKGALEATLR